MELWAEEAPSQQIQLHCRWQIFCIRRMGRSDVVARMLVELLDTLTAIQLHGRWQIFCIRRMGRSDVVARMLVELLDTLTAIQLHGRWQIFCIRRMGRSDVVARMLVELLDKEYIRAVAEAMAGLSTEEALQAVVQVSLTLASADRPDILADVSPPLSAPLHVYDSCSAQQRQGRYTVLSPNSATG